MKLDQPFATRDNYQTDPALAFKFWIELSGIVTAEFKECSGLRLERQVKTYQEGGVNDYVHILPGPVKYANIVFKYGAIHENPQSQTFDIWEWVIKGIHTGQVERKTFSILLRNGAGDIVRRWNVKDAFPVKWEGPQLKTDQSQIAVETLEVAHHGLTLDFKMNNGQ